MKPTEEQIKKFWEGCGLCQSEQQIQTGYRYYPDIDLNNLFKYAEETLVNHFIDTTTTEEEYRQAYYDFLCKWLKDYIWNEPHDPALALFWAIYKVMEVKNED